MDKDPNSAKSNISDDQRAVESALFSAGEALDTTEASEATGLSHTRTSEALEALVESSKTREGALEVVKQGDKYTLRSRSKSSIKAGAVGAAGIGLAGAGGAGGGESAVPSSGAGDSSALLPGGGESATSGGGPATLPGGGDPDMLPGGGARGGESTTINKEAKSVTSGSNTTGLRTTLGMMKSAFTLATIIILIAAVADVYKMYNDAVTINLEDHVTDANFWLTSDEEAIEGEISFDIPEMGYFEKSIHVQIHLKILESDPTTEDDFNFEYTLGSGNQTYDKFVLDNLDPVTKEKINTDQPLDIEYTITITVIYLGVELDATTSDVGTKVTRIQTA